jgi:metallo-beta-lactamase class B
MMPADRPCKASSRHQRLASEIPPRGLAQPAGTLVRSMRYLVFVALLAGLAEAPCHATPADWITPVSPFKISENLYYVGSRDLAAYLIVTPQGNILINANLESSPPQIHRSIEALGFRWTDTRILLNSQAHYDHVAGASEVLQETGAKQMVMDGDVDVVESGGATDFDSTLPHFPGSRVDRILHDGETVALGGTILTAHKTAGHTRGCTTWTMQTHAHGRVLNVVIVGGWAANPGVLLVPSHGRPAAYPGISTDFDRTFAILKALPCEIFLGAHGGYFDFLAKLDRLPKEGSSVWVDPGGYRHAVAELEAKYRAELALQQTSQ